MADAKQYAIHAESGRSHGVRVFVCYLYAAHILVVSLGSWFDSVFMDHDADPHRQASIVRSTPFVLPRKSFSRSRHQDDGTGQGAEFFERTRVGRTRGPDGQGMSPLLHRGLRHLCLLGRFCYANALLHALSKGCQTLLALTGFGRAWSTFGQGCKSPNKREQEMTHLDKCVKLVIKDAFICMRMTDMTHT